MVTPMQASLLCECIETRIANIQTVAGVKPVFILELYNESREEQFIKYLNCNSTTKGQYKVPHNSDFAKLYRLTLGVNSTKHFSEAHKILHHFERQWFVVNYELAQSKNKKYFKVINIAPFSPVTNDDWTLNGTLKKPSKKIRNLPKKPEEKLRIISGQQVEKARKTCGKTGEYESPNEPFLLGLEPVFYPTKTHNTQGNITNTQQLIDNTDLLPTEEWLIKNVADQSTQEWLNAYDGIHN